MNPSTIFNSSILSIHIPIKPLNSISKINIPTSTKNDKIELNKLELKELNEWVNLINNLEEREEAFYDETLPFYLTLKLPSNLTRSQAISFLIPETNSTSNSNSKTTTNAPHLSLTADLSFVDGPTTSTSASRSSQFAQQQQQQQRTRKDSFVTSFNLDLSEGAFTTSSAPPPPHSSDSKPSPYSPTTPNPIPSTRIGDMNYEENGREVPIWSYVFGENEVESNKKSSTLVNEEKDYESERGRVWVGREGGEESNGSWIGVWEFKGVVAYCKSNLIEPRLCVTVTITFRDDPKLEELLESLSSSSSTSTNDKSLSIEDDDEYMIESFDDVNLLEGLSESSTVHLPASRLPRLTSVNSSLPPLPTQRPSLSSHRRSISLSTNSEVPLYPAIRRAFRRILILRSPLNVQMRSISCPTVRGIALGLGLDENEGEGMILCVEIEGNDRDDENGIDQGGDDELGFEIESVEIEVSGGNGRNGDISVKRIKASESNSEGGVVEKSEDTTFPLLIRSKDQFNLLYAVTYTGQDESTAFDSITSLITPSPLYVSTPPSQRFSFKLSDGRIGDLIDSTPNQIDKEKDTMWMRNVGIIVKGKPVRFSHYKSSREPRNLLEGYEISDSPTIPTASTSSSTTFTSPTEPFTSRWNCGLDISTFANRSQSKTTTFVPVKPLPRSNTPFSTLAASSSASGMNASMTPAERRSRNVQPLEAIAGSKLHTKSNLISTTITSGSTSSSSYLTSPKSTARKSLDTSRALPTPPIPEVVASTSPSATTAASTAASVGRRFFSLPSSNTPPPPPPPSTSTNSLPSIPARIETPPPRPLSAQSNSSIDLNSIRRSSGLIGRSNSPVPTSSSSTVRRESLAVPGSLNISTSNVAVNGNGGVGIGHPTNFNYSNSIQPPLDTFKPYSGDILISVILLTPSSSASKSLTNSKPSTDLIGERGWRTPRVAVGDIFLVEVFVLNRSDLVKRFTVGVPSSIHSSNSNQIINSDQKEAKILALETDVRIGPLAPRTCQSVRLRFLAVTPGAHTVKELRLIDLGSGLETRLKEPVVVVVE